MLADLHVHAFAAVQIRFGLQDVPVSVSCGLVAAVLAFTGVCLFFS